MRALKINILQNNNSNDERYAQQVKEFRESKGKLIMFIDNHWGEGGFRLTVKREGCKFSHRLEIDGFGRIKLGVNKDCCDSVNISQSDIDSLITGYEERAGCHPPFYNAFAKMIDRVSVLSKSDILLRIPYINKAHKSCCHTFVIEQVDYIATQLSFRQLCKPMQESLQDKLTYSKFELRKLERKIKKSKNGAPRLSLKRESIDRDFWVLSQKMEAEIKSVGCKQ